MFALAVLASAAIGPRWVLSLDQSFDGKAGLAPDPKVWGRNLGGGGFGNEELEFCTDGDENAFLDGKGHLVLEARKEEREGYHYTSARLITQGRFEQRYGRFEARMMLPSGQGIWPAFWMVGSNIKSVGWPACGETDICEFVGKTPTTVYGTLNGPGYTGRDARQGRIHYDTLSTQFHTYGLEWTPNRMIWTFDGKPFHKVEAKDVAPHPWPFDKPQFLLLTLAVGGNFPGSPEASTLFPQRLVVDWIRVWMDRSPPASN